MNAHETRELILRPHWFNGTLLVGAGIIWLIAVVRVVIAIAADDPSQYVQAGALAVMGLATLTIGLALGYIWNSVRNGNRDQ
ncbi:hypothetical protein HII28_19810 [Planctomonas sp. JC2975]|uniref:hypothetical protein n=1 Tax=Planctomonas sp. JC2975 TaxID=2729626 RepID=UPI0014741789|nr:hypothetical protein [Planctomonas sp. JC2975]NNC14103.1 hypothetical protein [Planctomonas sp. JC2975]